MIRHKWDDLDASVFLFVPLGWKWVFKRFFLKQFIAFLSVEKVFIRAFSLSERLPSCPYFKQFAVQGINPP